MVVWSHAYGVDWDQSPSDSPDLGRAPLTRPRRLGDFPEFNQKQYYLVDRNGGPVTHKLNIFISHVLGKYLEVLLSLSPINKKKVSH